MVRQSSGEDNVRQLTVVLDLVLKLSDLLDDFLALVSLFWVVTFGYGSEDIVYDTGAVDYQHSLMLPGRGYGSWTDMIIGHLSRAVGHANEFLSAVV